MKIQDGGNTFVPLLSDQSKPVGISRVEIRITADIIQEYQSAFVVFSDFLRCPVQQIFCEQHIVTCKDGKFVRVLLCPAVVVFNVLLVCGQKAEVFIEQIVLETISDQGTRFR